MITDFDINQEKYDINQANIQGEYTFLRVRKKIAMHIKVRYCFITCIKPPHPQLS